jgi:hypothetical protein
MAVANDSSYLDPVDQTQNHVLAAETSSELLVQCLGRGWPQSGVDHHNPFGIVEEKDIHHRRAREMAT